MEKEQDIINKAKSIPYQFWWEIEYLIDQASTEELKHTLYWIMRGKELLEQAKSR